MRYLEFFKRQMLLTHIGGIPIRIDYRWFLVFRFHNMADGAESSALRQ